MKTKNNMSYKNKNTKLVPSIGSVGGKPIELTNALSLSMDSKNYLQAAKILNKNYAIELSIPIYFLTLRSIELGFKSILRIKEGIPIQDLKDTKQYGHNLTKLMNRCIKQRYLSLSKKDSETIRSINKYYYDKHFEYSKLGNMDLYDIHYYISIAEKINKRFSEITKEIGTTRYI